MAKYEIVYDYEDERNIREDYCGSWSELQDYIKQMRKNGCYHIDATCVDDDFDGEYIPC